MNLPVAATSPSEESNIKSAPDNDTPFAGAMFQTDVALRWGDLDARQHLNNTLYFRLMEEGRIQAFAGLGVTDLSENGIILASISCDFLRSLTYPSTARIRHRVARIGRSSLDMDVLIERSDEPGVLYARGREVLVWVNYASGKSAPWPSSVLNRLQSA